MSLASQKRDCRRFCFLVGGYSLSFSLRRLWFLDRLEPGRSHYKVGEGVRCLGPLNVEILQRAIGEFIERDKSLRTGIGKDDGKPWAEHLPV